MGYGSKRKKKAYCSNAAKRQKHGCLQAGMKGILITCNYNEKQCVREAYNVLNEYGDKLYGNEFEKLPCSPLADEDNIEEQLKKELDFLKSDKSERRFQQVDTKVKNVLFIHANVPSPVDLAHSIFEDVKLKGKRTRYISKFIPVTATSKCPSKDVKKSLATVLEPYAANEQSTPHTYKVVCKIRNNSSVENFHFINCAKEAVEEMKLQWKAVLLDPEIIVFFNVLQSICCISVLQNYEAYKKYNLAEVCPPETKDSPKARSSTTSETLSADTKKSIETQPCSTSTGEAAETSPVDMKNQLETEACTEDCDNADDETGPAGIKVEISATESVD